MTFIDSFDSFANFLFNTLISWNKPKVTVPLKIKCLSNCKVPSSLYEWQFWDWATDRLNYLTNSTRWIVSQTLSIFPSVELTKKIVSQSHIHCWHQIYWQYSAWYRMFVCVCQMSDDDLQLSKLWKMRWYKPYLYVKSVSSRIPGQIEAHNSQCDLGIFSRGIGFRGCGLVVGVLGCGLWVACAHTYS